MLPDPVFVDSYKKVGNAWLTTLLPHERQELASLEMAYQEHYSNSAVELMNVTKDWIEEHGGERQWWLNLRLTTDLDNWE